MADVDIAMLEPMLCPSTVKTKALTRMTTRPRRECRQRKRSFDSDPQFSLHHLSKRTKCDLSEADEHNSDSACPTFALDSDTDDENDTESKCSTSDTEQTPPINVDLVRQFDENSDIEDYNDNNDDESTNQTIYFSKLSTDQHANIPVVANQSSLTWQQPWTIHSRRLMRQFKYLYDHGLRKPIEPTRCPNEQSIIDTEEMIQNKIRWELRNTFNRLDLFKEGYSVLSNESFPFHSLCYMCGSMGSDLIYCNSCCEPYHSACLNELERPRLCPTPDSWLCPNCNVCNICGLLSHPTSSSRSLIEQCSQLIACADCKRNFHLKCIKRSKDEQQTQTEQSRSFRYQSWFCPSCIKCDCGQTLTSNERNLLALNKSFSAQQSLMCNDCLNNMKMLRMKKSDNIEKCHLCDRYIEQLITKSQPSLRPLFSMTLIGDRSQQQTHQQQTQQQRTINLLQCVKCKHRFHPKCDAYLNEDATLVPHIKTICLNIVCSKCDHEERNKIKKCLIDYKLQVVKNTIASITSTLQIMISEDDRLNDMQRYMCHLQQLHESRENSLNLHAFLNDLLIVVRRLLSNIDMRRWQAAIDGCIMRQCPWFKSSSSISNALLCSSSNITITTHHPSINRYSTPASSDHNYAMSSERIFLESSAYTNNLLSSSDSLIRFMDNNNNNEESCFSNLHNIDTRKCQLCQTFADRLSPHIGRLISIGLNQWVHVGCILPAYAKSLDEPPYILRNIRETVFRCQSKYICSICSKLGATVQCIENECGTRFHCECIQKYYSNNSSTMIQQQFNLINGLLPNLTTLCSKHNGINGKKATATHRDSSDAGEDISIDGKEYSATNSVNVSKTKSVNLSSAVYGDLSCNIVEFPLADTHLCIGSLQIDSLGNYDYLLDNQDEQIANNDSVTTYPDNYCASRLYWSTKHARTKTVYHLQVQIEQTYHNESSNHQTIAHPMSDEQLHMQQLYDTCRKYFDELQKKIDEHQRSVDRLCQKTIVTKKSKAANSESQNPPTTGTDKKKTTNTGSGNTKKTKETPSCVKRQTPKSALKNVTRPRNRFGNENMPKMNTTEFNSSSATINNHRGSLTMKPTNYHKTPERHYKPGESVAIDTKQLRNLLNDNSFKPSTMPSNMSPFAMALAQALQHIGQSLPSLAAKPQQEPILSYYLSDQMNPTANGSINPKNPGDLLFEQLLKSFALSQPPLNGSNPPIHSHSQASSTSHWRLSSTTMTTSSNQTNFLPMTRSFDDPSHSHSPSDGTSPLPYAPANTFNLSHNKPCIIPQMDGTIDDEDESFLISANVLNSLLELIVDNEDNIDRLRADSEHSLDLSAGVTPPQLDFIAISPNRLTIPSKESTPPRKKLAIDDLIASYKQWYSSKSGRVTFTITSDDGYSIVSEDLDEAWSTIVNLVRECRDDMNLCHLPMSNTKFNGHRAFGLCKTVVKTMLNQSLPSQLPQIGTTILPLSSSNNNAIWLLKNSNNENSNLNANNDRQRSTKKKNNNDNNASNKVTSSCSRSSIYERKRRGRQRFGWLLNHSRKIEYAQKTFEIDEALAHARRIILEEASVSLRLHHLHYFSERSLLVGSSPIHGCGLFTLIDLVEGQMIVEYTGEVVRPCLTDKRERENEGKGFGCYMFTVDTMHVIDATNRGNKARFINHNCQPNCFAKTVLSGGVKHIVIYALMDIPSGSELTYDYSFPEEDIKIPCHCGTSKCRIYLN